MAYVAEELLRNCLVLMPLVSAHAGALLGVGKPGVWLTRSWPVGSFVQPKFSSEGAAESKACLQSRRSFRIFVVVSSF